MSKLLTNQISNYADNGPVEAKEGLNFATGKPLQISGGSGTSGQYLKSTGSSIEWTTFPSIPSAQVNTDWNATSGVAQILNKPSLSTVATTGSYTDLINQPTIPAAQLQSDWSQSNSASLDFIKNKPTLFDGQYASLSGAPSVPATVNDLQDVNIPNPVDNRYIKWDSSSNRWIQGTGSAGILDIVEDQSPQLGGTLDANGNDIDMGANLITDAGVNNWNAAYGWGNHAAAGYVTAYTNTTYSQQAIQDNADVKLRLTGSDGVLDDIKVTAGTNVTFTSVGSQGFTINATAQQSGGATVTTSDSAPSAPDDGDLWWKSDEGRLKVFYQDVNGSQWVDANPPLAPTVLTNGTNKVQVSTTASATQDAVELWGGNAKRWRMVQGGTLLPNADDAYDIGSSSFKVRDLYLGPTSLHIGSLDISESSGKLVLPAVEMTGHIIPDTNAAYDLGNAEYKIRHLFLSDNTLYHQGPFIKTAQHDAGGSAQTASYVITLAKLKQALNASSDFDTFKSAILAITDA